MSFSPFPKRLCIFLRGTGIVAATLLHTNTIMQAEQETFHLVRSGTPAVEIAILNDDPLQDLPGSWKSVQIPIEGAAGELAYHLEEISGVSIPLHKLASKEASAYREQQVRAEGKTPILLGTLALERLGALTAEEEAVLKDPSGFVIRAENKAILIAGRTPTAVACGVYAFLEDLGVRWFFPGDLGTVIPKDPQLAIPTGTRAERPTLAARHFQNTGSDEWVRRQRAGGLYFPSAHGIPIGKTTVEENPELYALVKGERTSRQLCVSNPEVLKRAITETKVYFRTHPEAPWLGMGPNDGSGFCECSSCRAWDGDDFDPFSAAPSVTDRYIEFFNRVLVGIEDEFPDKQIAFYIYHTYMRPPVKVQPDSRIAGALAPIALCRVHGPNNPMCPERSYLKTLIDGWLPLLPNLYERGYWYNLADPAMPFVQIHRLKDEIPYYAKAGAKGYRTECNGQWALQGPSLYIAGKLLWNAAADPDALLRDFCEKLFGPAAAPMEAYFTFLDQQMEESDHHTGGAFNVQQFYPPGVRAKAAQHLAAAHSAAVASPWKERVAVFAEGFQFFDAFAQMIESQHQHKWSETGEHLATFDRLHQRLTSYTPALIGKSSESHFKRFFRPTIEQGIARTSGGNRLVAPLKPDWHFLIDPLQIGEGLNYQSPRVTGGNWQRLSIEKQWSDVGLRYYKGLAWYRQQVEIPTDAIGKRLFLWFGGVDESARVWVNGTLVGTSPISAFTPFEVDATPAIRQGRNEVVVCVANLRVNELGTGGLIGPSFFYAPEKGDDAALDNLKPLRETFP